MNFLTTTAGRLLVHVPRTPTGTCSGCCFEDFTCKAPEDLKGQCFRDGGIFKDVTDLRAIFEEGFKAGVEHGHRSFGTQPTDDQVDWAFKKTRTLKQVAA